MTKMCVLGLGYIGLPTALLFANNGNEVVGVSSSHLFSIVKDAASNLKRWANPYGNGNTNPTIITSLIMDFHYEHLQ